MKVIDLDEFREGLIHAIENGELYSIVNTPDGYEFGWMHQSIIHDYTMCENAYKEYLKLKGLEGLVH